MFTNTEALERHQGKAVICRRFTRLNIQARGNCLAQALVAHHPAAHTVAHANNVLADPVQFVRCHLQKFGNILNALVRNPATMPLHNFQCLDRCRLFMRIMFKFGFDFSFFFFAQHDEIYPV